VIEGGADRDEPPLNAARRELREEAGLTAREWRQVGGELHLSNCFSNEVAHIFVAQGLTEVGAEPDETEVLALRTVPLDECLRMIDSGEMKDSLSILALLKTDRLLRDGSLQKQKPLP
jgi:8-oxo-dGTP pyrophosphatase MutT (NUDIX family)